MLWHIDVPESNEACISNRISIDCAHSSDDHIELLRQLLYQLWIGFQNELSPGQSRDRKPDDAVGAGEVRQERLLSERLTVYHSLGVHAIGFSSHVCVYCLLLLFIQNPGSLFQARDTRDGRLRRKSHDPSDLPRS